MVLDSLDNVAGQRTILIVDDTPQNLTILGECLRSEYRVRAVNSGERALRAAATPPYPDLILLDVMMPGMSGHDVLRQLRATPQTRDIPVIFITAMDGAENEELGLSLGAVDYIAKPIIPAVVLARLRTHLELKQARDRLANQNEWLEREVARRINETVLIQDLSVRALASLAEARDNETGHHILRTQSYVRLLAEHLREHPRFQAALDGRRLSMVVKAAPLHDIGKVGIPDSILLKPGRLTEAEFAIMKTHPLIGAEALGKATAQALAEANGISSQQASGAVAFLHIAREISLSHHEKWDGSGYPHGLGGDDIPVGGRLMALADVFDALITRRVYKAPMSPEQTSEIICSGRGLHFDPTVVDAFLVLRERFMEIARQYPDSEGIR